MSLPWAKMWVEALDDPKLIRLSLAERGAWWGLIKLARKLDPEGRNTGRIETGGQGLDMAEITDALHIKADSDRQALDSMIEKMKSRGSLSWNGSVLTIVHFGERQRIPPSAHREAVAERVRLYRERQKKEASPRGDEGAFIFGQSIEKAKRIAAGEYPDIPESKRGLYRKELKRRGIPF